MRSYRSAKKLLLKTDLECIWYTLPGQRLADVNASLSLTYNKLGKAIGWGVADTADAVPNDSTLKYAKLS